MKYENKDKIKGNIKAVGIVIFLIVMTWFWWNFQARKTTYPAIPSSSVEEIEEQRCIRSVPYPKPAEFDRVLSLILQRQQQANHPYTSEFRQMQNCLDIQYTDLKNKNGAEGVFYFDSQVSTANKLVLEVDRSYAITDDITTAYLLSHELTHARQYVETISGRKQWICTDSEVEAFYEQLVFGSLLNDEESQSVISRLEDGSQNTQLRQYEQLLNMSWDAIQTCGLGNNATQTSAKFSCWQNNVRQQIKEMIVSNPFYQEQCQGEL